MIGIVVTGHGNFASGMTSSINLIAGPQKDYYAVDFSGEGTDELEADLQAAFEGLKDCSGIIVFCDLLGGSPFKTAAVLSQGMPDVKIITGTNLPMLCEISVARTMFDDIDMLVSAALNVGKDGVKEFVMPTVVEEQEADEDGI